MPKKSNDRGILILSDMEGVSGLIDERLQDCGETFWKVYGRYLLTEDINTIAATLWSGGIKRVYLSESHNLGKNTVPENLLPFITVLPPHSAQSNMHGKFFWDKIYREKNIVAAIMVGSHSMSGTTGFLSHSWDMKIFDYIKVNGKPFGEIGLIAGLLGYYDIPLIAVVGDEAAIQEAKEIVPEITGVAVKRVEKNGWISVLRLDLASDLIRKKILESLEYLANVKPFKFREPVELSFKVKKDEYLVKITGDRKVRRDKNIIYIQFSNYPQAYNVFWECYLKMLMG